MVSKNHDLTATEYCDIRLYENVDELITGYSALVSECDVAIIGSYVPDGIRVAQWLLEHVSGVTAFYDIDTPITISDLRAGRCQYLAPELIPEFDLYLSFTGGRFCRKLNKTLAPNALARWPVPSNLRCTTRNPMLTSGGSLAI